MQMYHDLERQIRRMQNIGDNSMYDNSISSSLQQNINDDQDYTQENIVCVYNNELFQPSNQYFAEKIPTLGQQYGDTHHQFGNQIVDPNASTCKSLKKMPIQIVDPSTLSPQYISGGTWIDENNQLNQQSQCQNEQRNNIQLLQTHQEQPLTKKKAQSRKKNKHYNNAYLDIAGDTKNVISAFYTQINKELKIKFGKGSDQYCKLRQIQQQDGLKSISTQKQFKQILEVIKNIISEDTLSSLLQKIVDNYESRFNDDKKILMIKYKGYFQQVPNNLTLKGLVLKPRKKKNDSNHPSNQIENQENTFNDFEEEYEEVQNGQSYQNNDYNHNNNNYQSQQQQENNNEFENGNNIQNANYDNSQDNHFNKIQHINDDDNHNNYYYNNQVNQYQEHNCVNNEEFIYQNQVNNNNSSNLSFQQSYENNSGQNYQQMNGYHDQQSYYQNTGYQDQQINKDQNENGFNQINGFNRSSDDLEIENEPYYEHNYNNGSFYAQNNQYNNISNNNEEFFSPFDFSSQSNNQFSQHRFGNQTITNYQYP